MRGELGSGSADDDEPLSDDSLDGDAPMEDDSLLRAIAAAPTPRLRTWLPPGTLIGTNYRIESKLGAGAMGTVYAATDLALDRRVAIKLHANAQADAQTSRMWREAKAMARLQDPHVVAVHEVGVHEGRVYIAMELVEGSSAKEWLATPHGWREILEVFIQAARGLAAAHRVGLVHRDFKPANLLIEHTAGGIGRVRVADFGLARAASEGEASTSGSSGLSSGSGPALDQRMTQTGVAVGTPAYMAPEQHAGRVDHRSDQYAFFVTLYEALYGVRPFPGETVAEVVTAARAGEVHAAPADRPVPPWLRQVVLRGLRAAPEQRHVDMDAVVHALQSDPTRRRRTQLAVAGGIGVMGGLLGVIVHLAGRAQGGHDCDAQAAAIDGSWNDDARGRVRDAMLATQVAYAEQAWTRAESGLDAWSEAWSSAAQSACEGDDVALDATLHRARAMCLDHRRRSFTALIEVLGEANATTVERAAAAVGNLPEIETCSDVERLAAQADLQPEPRLASAVDDVRIALSRAEAFEQAGVFDQGTRVAEAALADARTLGWSPLLAESLLVLGELEDAAGKYEGAEATLRECYSEALASGADDIAVDAASVLTRTVGFHLARHLEGLEWGYHASVLSRRVGPEPKREATLLESLAAVHQLRSEYDLALDELTRALAIREDAGGHDQLQLSTTLGNLGELHRGRGELGLASVQLTRALEIRERALGPEHPAVASVLAALATVELDNDHREAAAAHARRALAIRERALGAEHPDVAAIMANLGVIVGELGSHAEALTLLRRALGIQRRVLGDRHPRVASTLEMIGNEFLLRDELEQARPHYLEALEIRETALGPEHHHVAKTLSNLGLLSRGLRRDDEALAYLRRALAIDERVLGPNHPDVAHTLNNLGASLSDVGDLEGALGAQRRALAIRTELLGPDHVDLVDTYLNLGIVLTQLGRWDEACAELRRALASAERAQPPRPRKVAVARLYIGRAELGRGDSRVAVEELERALVVQESVESDAASLADVRFALALALTGAGAERERAHELARAAQVGYAAIPGEEQNGDEVRAWLRRHPQPRATARGSSKAGISRIASAH